MNICWCCCYLRPEECVQSQFSLTCIVAFFSYSVSCGERPCAQRILLPPQHNGLFPCPPMPRWPLLSLRSRSNLSNLFSADWRSAALKLGRAPSSWASGLSLRRGGSVGGGGGSSLWCLPAACHVNLLSMSCLCT